MGVIYTHFASPMLGVIRRYVADRDDAFDILHDGFIVAFTRIGTLKNPQRLEQWLATIMKNLALKFINSETSGISFRDISPENYLMETEEKEEIPDFDTLQFLISRLPPGYQAVFRLAMLEHKSHKEISTILGIAPNTSSSQLFHAKQFLRKLIIDYRDRLGLLCVLLTAITTGILYLHYKSREKELVDSMAVNSGTDTVTESGKVEYAQNTTIEQNLNPQPVPPSFSSASQKATVQCVFSSLPLENEECKKNLDSTTDTTLNDKRNLLSDNILTDDAPTQDSSPTCDGSEMPDRDPLEWAAIDQYDLPDSKSDGNGWITGIEVNSGIANFKGYHVENAVASPGDVGKNLAWQPHRNHLPQSVTLTAERRLLPVVGLETGIGYTYIHSDFEGPLATTDCHWHYLSFPLKINLYAYKGPRFTIYGSLGGDIHIPVYSNADVHAEGINPGYGSGRFHSSPFWSVGGGIGISMSLSRYIDVYLEPSITYHFPNNDLVPNVWTDEPWGFSVPFGIRFKW